MCAPRNQMVPQTQTDVTSCANTLQVHERCKRATLTRHAPLQQSIHTDSPPPAVNLATVPAHVSPARLIANVATIVMRLLELPKSR
jgi:hypothetical protein